MTNIAVKRWSKSEQNAVREQLARIIRSAPFEQSRRRQRFLEYLVNETLDDRGERLKGYSIALEIFSRPEAFDPVVDPIVRIEAKRLREKLNEFYETYGRSDPIRIELQKGTYIPQFKVQTGSRSAPQSSGSKERRTAVDERPSLAILPFVNMSARRGNDYLADGLTDALITELAKVSGLFVVSRQSSFAYRRSKPPLPQIAANLRVRYLVEGRVQTERGRIRITANLVDTASDQSIWSERYDRSLRDFFAVQDEVSRSIVRALHVKLTLSENRRVGQEGTRNSNAHDELLRGLQDFWRYSREACAEAQQHFSSAVSLDPHYAAAHAWLARTYVFQYGMGWSGDSKSIMGSAVDHARRAVELDDDSSLAHSIFGWILLFLKDGENAVAEGRRACAIDSNSAEAKVFLSLILASTNQGEEGLSNIETAMLLQPHPSSFYFFALGICHFARADYERAIGAFVRGIEVNPSFMPNHYELAVTYGVCGRAKEARAEAAIVKADCPNVFKEFFFQSPLDAIWLRGKRIAGLA